MVSRKTIRGETFWISYLKMISLNLLCGASNFKIKTKQRLNYMIELCHCGNKPKPFKPDETPTLWTIVCCELKVIHPIFHKVIDAWNVLIKGI